MTGQLTYTHTSLNLLQTSTAEFPALQECTEEEPYATEIAQTLDYKTAVLECAQDQVQPVLPELLT